MRKTYTCTTTRRLRRVGSFFLFPLFIFSFFSRVIFFFLLAVRHYYRDALLSCCVSTKNATKRRRHNRQTQMDIIYLYIYIYIFYWVLSVKSVIVRASDFITNIGESREYVPNTLLSMLRRYTTRDVYTLHINRSSNNKLCRKNGFKLKWLGYFFIFFKLDLWLSKKKKEKELTFLHD